MSEEGRIQYPENQEFNDDFDLDNLEIKIGHLTPYKASYVLYSVDYDAYLLAIEEFKQRREEDAKDLIFSDYPQPISYYYHQSENGFSNNNHRLQLLRSTWEAIIFSLYAIVIGEARSKHLPLRNIAVQDVDGNPDLSFNDYFSDRLGQRLLIIERILNYCISNSINLRCLNIIPLATIQKIRRLNQERNEFMHTAAISEEQASLRYSELNPEVFEVLKDLSGLAFVELLRFVENAGSVTALRCEVFKGFSLARNITTFQIDPLQLASIANELNNQNILVNYQGEMFSITPFYHFNTEANGNRTNLCYCKRKHSSTRYEYEIVTRSESYEIDGAVFTDRITELMNLII